MTIQQKFVNYINDCLNTNFLNFKEFETSDQETQLKIKDLLQNFKLLPKKGKLSYENQAEQEFLQNTNNIKRQTYLEYIDSNGRYRRIRKIYNK